jgi:hypothetical protein
MEQLIAGYFKKNKENQNSLPCPSEETLWDYMSGRLPARASEQVAQHLCSCDLCARTLVAAAETEPPALEEVPGQGCAPLVSRRVLQQIPQPVSAGWRGWGRALAERIREAAGAAAGWLYPASAEYVYVRGRTHVISKNLVVLEKEFKDITLEIELEKTDTQSTDIKVYARRPGIGAPADGLRINLYAGDAETASCVTHRGEALFEQLGFGEYRLRVMENEKNRGEVLLTIKEQ